MAASVWICAVVAALTVVRGLPLDGPLEPSADFHDQPPLKINVTVSANGTVAPSSTTSKPTTATTNSTGNATVVTTEPSTNGTGNATQSISKPTTPTPANSTSGFNVTDSPLDVENATMTTDVTDVENATTFANSTTGFNVTEASVDAGNATAIPDLTELENATTFENSTTAFNVTDSPVDTGNATVIPGVSDLENSTSFENSTATGFNVTESAIDVENATMTSDLSDVENATLAGNSTESGSVWGEFTTESSNSTESGNVTESTMDVTTVNANTTDSDSSEEEIITLSPIETGNATETASGEPEVSVPVNTTEPAVALSTTATAVNGTESATTEEDTSDEPTTTASSNATLTTHPHLRWVHATKTTTPAPEDKFKVVNPTIPSGKGLRICTWNVFRFGPTKFKEPDEFVPRYGKPKLHMMIEQISNCDMLALQEYFDPSLEVLNRLAKALSKNTGSAWNFTVSERVGRTSQEQYVFLYRTEVAQAQEQSICPDPDDVYSRDPFFTKFKITKKDTCFSDIVLGTIHTEPEQAVAEMNELVKSYDWAEKKFKTKNVMVLGDYNGDCQYVRKSEWPNVKLYTDKSFKWFIPTGTDTASMASECTFDRAVVREDKLFKCFTEMKVLDFVEQYKIKVAEARQLSDHFPVVLHFN